MRVLHPQLTAVQAAVRLPALQKPAGCDHSCQELGHGFLCEGLFLTLSFCVGRHEASVGQDGAGLVAGAFMGSQGAGLSAWPVPEAPQL